MRLATGLGLAGWLAAPALPAQDAGVLDETADVAWVPDWADEAGWEGEAPATDDPVTLLLTVTLDRTGECGGAEAQEELWSWLFPDEPDFWEPGMEAELGWVLMAEDLGLLEE